MKKYNCRKKSIKIVVFLAITCRIAWGQPFLKLPVRGNYGSDFIVVNYVDWKAGNGILDYHCGNKTYDGHQGTDFVIRSFFAMDKGIDVLAAADGVVIDVKDGFFDREKSSDISKGFGNYIAIKHFNGYFSYYAHLAKGSIVVSIGDTLKAGDTIAKVGSSGNSTDPHLHFELWYDSVQLVDPFEGTCGNSRSLWLEMLPYDTSFHIWTSGLTNFIPTLDELREEPKKLNHFTNADEFITYWAILYGLKKGDSLVIKWYSPTGLLWFTNHYYAKSDAWYFYYWNYIHVPHSATEGKWSAQLFRNSSFVDEITFTTQIPNSAKEEDVIQSFAAYPNPLNHENTISWQSESGGYTKLDILDIFGNQIKTLVDEYRHPGKHTINYDSKELTSGIYFYQLKVGNQIATKKIIIIK